MERLVSVIMPTYKRDYIISEALVSLKNQTFKDFEVLVIDDGSEDNTENIVKQYEDLEIFYIKLDKNYGANYARNVGIAKARGKYLAFLDSDNEWLPSNLDIKVSMLQDTDVKVGFVFGSFFVEKGDHKEIFQPTDIETTELLKRKMLNTNVIDTNTVLVKKECFQKIGGFDEQLKRLQDWDMFGRILFDGEYEAVFCECPLVINKMQKDSISMDNDRLFASWDRILHKRWKDYRKEHIAVGILDEYLFTHIEKTGVSIQERLKSLLQFDIAEDEWNWYWEKKLTLTERMQLSDRNWRVFKKWVLLEEQNIGIVDWLEKHQIRQIAIYGYGYLGKHLLHELTLSGRKVNYILDKNKKVSQKSVPVFHSLENIPVSEIIIVTAVAYFEEIQENLKQYTSAKIVSLEKILDNLLDDMD